MEKEHVFASVFQSTLQGAREPNPMLAHQSLFSLSPCPRPASLSLTVFFNLCVCVHVCVCLCRSAVLPRAEEGFRSWSQSHRQLWATLQCVLCKNSMCSLTAERSPQPHSSFLLSLSSIPKTGLVERCHCAEHSLPKCTYPDLCRQSQPRSTYCLSTRRSRLTKCWVWGGVAKNQGWSLSGVKMKGGQERRPFPERGRTQLVQSFLRFTLVFW